MPELTIAEIVTNAVEGTYSIPEFQREFVWKPKQVADLADSLCRGFPVGCLVLWHTSEDKGPFWIIDGQQRVTALSILFGRKPSWGPESRWDSVLRTSKSFLNVSQDGHWSIGGRVRGRLNIELAEILKSQTQDDLDETIRGALDQATDVRLSDDLRDTLVKKAQDVFGIREQQIPIIVTGMTEPMELAEAYQRLNEKGTRIRETDTQIAFIAIRNPGWVRDEFRGFVRKLEDEKWPISPGALLRTMTILYSGTPRVGSIKEPDKFWQAAPAVFQPLKAAAEDILVRIKRYGIHEYSEIPSEYSFVALLAIHTKFNKSRGYDFDKLFKWFVAANLRGRYGDAPLETLSNDGKFIHDNGSFADVIGKLEIFEEDVNFKEMLEAKFSKSSPQALLLKAMLWDSAIDWKRGGKLSTTPPLEWHHILPKKLCDALGFEKGIENKTANITLLSADANKAFKDQAPWVYAPRDIRDVKRLTSHWVPSEYAQKFLEGRSISDSRDFGDFLSSRGSLIAEEAKQFLRLRPKNVQDSST